jgi:hypothetical protein
MSEVVLLLPNTDRFQQVEDNIRVLKAMSIWWKQYNLGHNHQLVESD